MNSNFIKLAFSLMVFFFSFVTNAQLVEVAEDAIGFEILKWHYAKYPMSTIGKWEIDGATGQFQATFQFEGRAIMAVYNTKGKIQREVVDMTSDVPVSLAHTLDEEFADNKYKVVQFKRITDFASDQKYFEMELKSKSRGNEARKFDADLIPVATSNNSTLASAN